MPKQKDPKLQNRLRNWVRQNPDRWYTAKMEDIIAETHVSRSTADRYFALIVAREAGIPPSEIKKKREEHHGTSPRFRKLSDAEIAEIHRLFEEGHTTLDIAFATGRSLSQVEKYKPKKQTPAATDDAEE